MKTKEELLKQADKVWESPNYDDLLELVGELVRYIEEN